MIWIILAVGVVLVFVFGNITLRWSKTYRKVACKIGWHSFPHFNKTGFDGCSVHAKCKWCGYEGMVDGQGNLF
jgi:hypothetical protein